MWQVSNHRGRQQRRKRQLRGTHMQIPPPNPRPFQIMLLAIIYMLWPVVIRAGDSVFKTLFSRLSRSSGNQHHRSFYDSTISSTIDTPTDVLTNNKMVRSISKITIPPLLFLFFAVTSCEASPLNAQPIALFGPFFQGWLVRTVDHTCRRSFILIVGSFSKRGSRIFDEHYVFCGVETADGVQHFETFPEPSSVTITSTSRSLPFPTEISPFAQPTNITWSAKDVGSFCFNENECKADFKLNGARIQFNSKQRIPWSKRNIHSEGPEGILGYIPYLLPCHYFVHSVGSSCEYTLDLPCDTNKQSSHGIRTLLSNTQQLSGHGYSHIEGNHGTCFPTGWIWAQAISKDNQASFSLTGGKFEIGFLSPLNFILFVRIGEKKPYVFRTTDLDSMEYDLDGHTGVVKITAQSLSKSSQVEITIQPFHTFEKSFGKHIFIPTPKGFSNTPGCRETYSATANVVCSEWDHTLNQYVMTESISFPLTALEFGGAFQGIRQLSKAKQKDILKNLE